MKDVFLRHKEIISSYLIETRIIERKSREALAEALAHCTTEGGLIELSEVTNLLTDIRRIGSYTTELILWCVVMWSYPEGRECLLPGLDKKALQYKLNLLLKAWNEA